MTPQTGQRAIRPRQQRWPSGHNAICPATGWLSAARYESLGPAVSQRFAQAEEPLPATRRTRRSGAGCCRRRALHSATRSGSLQRGSPLSRSSARQSCRIPCSIHPQYAGCRAGPRWHAIPHRRPPHGGFPRSSPWRLRPPAPRISRGTSEAIPACKSAMRELPPR